MAMKGVSRYDSGLDSLEATELRLGLPGIDNARVNKRTSNDLDGIGDQQVAPVTKAQAVGWPPVRSYRNNSFRGRKTTETDACGAYMKVSMDGAPFLRKIDLKVYKGYEELTEALHNLFNCFSAGEFSRKEEKLSSEYAITYEDKDGDWMLVGDVPWGMFTSSCKKLRIMRRLDSNK